MKYEFDPIHSFVENTRRCPFFLFIIKRTTPWHHIVTHRHAPSQLKTNYTSTRLSGTRRRPVYMALNTGLCLQIRGPSSSYCAFVWHTR